MILMITLAVVLMLVFYKPQQKVEGFDASAESVWGTAPATCKGQNCIEDGFRCIKANGIPTTESEEGKCLKCKNNNDLIDTNTTAGSIKCALGPVPFVCPECENPTNN